MIVKNRNAIVVIGLPRSLDFYVMTEVLLFVGIMLYYGEFVTLLSIVPSILIEKRICSSWGSVLF